MLEIGKTLRNLKKPSFFLIKKKQKCWNFQRNKTLEQFIKEEEEIKNEAKEFSDDLSSDEI